MYPKMKKSLLFLFLLPLSLFSQNEKELKVSYFVEGTILVPETEEKTPLAIIIGGSGPIDRNGNQPMMKHNSAKLLAEALYEKGIAVFRYDKRIVKQMKERNLNESEIRFDDFIQDAMDVLDYFQRANAFSKIYVLGHSQGSLVGMIAAKNKADGFISLAGAGQPIDAVILDQLEKQVPGLLENARTAFEEIKANGSTTNYSPGLASIFRPQIQPFMNSWMKYNPQNEISKLNIPVLIVNGDNDLQVKVSEAEMLAKANPSASLTIIPTMNHIFRNIEGDDIDNSKSYNDPSLPISEALVSAIFEFINQ